MDTRRLSVVEVFEDGVWASLDDDEEYWLVSTDHLRNGNDGYEMSNEFEWVKGSILVRNVLAEHINKNVVNPKFGWRIGRQEID